MQKPIIKLPRNYPTFGAGSSFIPPVVPGNRSPWWGPATWKITFSMIGSRCSGRERLNFITANSTFSWWGAWLSCHEGKIVITPGISLKGITAWGFPGLLPESWIKIL